jgi:hypothetical protein
MEKLIVHRSTALGHAVEKRMLTSRAQVLSAHGGPPKSEFAPDSALEGAGFEPSVPEGIKTSQDGW